MGHAWQLPYGAREVGSHPGVARCSGLLRSADATPAGPHHRTLPPRVLVVVLARSARGGECFVQPEEMRGIVRRLHRRHPQGPQVAQAVLETLNATPLESYMSLERMM